jgi:hypothetical protein
MLLGRVPGLEKAKRTHCTGPVCIRALPPWMTLPFLLREEACQEEQSVKTEWSEAQHKHSQGKNDGEQEGGGGAARSGSGP